MTFQTCLSLLDETCAKSCSSVSYFSELVIRHKCIGCLSDFLIALQFNMSFMICFVLAMLQSFKEMVAICLVKDPSKRPTAEQLLSHPFFKKAQTCDFICQNVLDGLPPLAERAKQLKVSNVVHPEVAADLS